MKYKLILLSFLVVFVPSVRAQFPAILDYGNVNVRVTYADGRAVTIRPLVQLMNSSGPVAEDYANDDGMVYFPHVEIGMYHVRVTGPGIADADSGMVEVDERKTVQFLFVKVYPVGQAKSGSGPKVAANELNIPAKARKEFDKAGDLLSQKEWQKAIERLKRVLELYPDYAAAYNNLAVAYGHLGDRAHEREALQHAISIDDHFAAALLNLARLDINDHDFTQAETLLDKATAADPNNPESLMLLGNIQLVEKHYEEAILTCRKAHAIAHERYAVVHYIAARALEQLNRLREAAAELQTFLQEEPSGPRTEGARKELASVQEHLVQ